MHAALHFIAATTLGKIAVKTRFCSNLTLGFASLANDHVLDRYMEPREHIRAGMNGAVWCSLPAQLTGSAYRFSQAVTNAGYKDHDVQQVVVPGSEKMRK